MSKIVDNIIAFKLLKMLITPFDQTDAFKQGIIDAEGKLVKKPLKLITKQQQEAYTYLTRFIFNMKRMINKFGGENRLKSLATALYLFKEETENLIVRDRLLLEAYEESLEDMFLMIMEDSDFKLDIDFVESVLKEEMVTTAAIPNEPTIKPKKILRRKKQQQMK